MGKTKDIETAIEGILFAAGESVEIKRICECLGISGEQAEEAIKELRDYYNYERRGIRLIVLEDSCQLCSAPELSETIVRTLETRKPPKLSPAALETLSVIAYYQPTTRGYIEQIRGVDSSYTVGLLLDRGLIEEAGTLAVPGRPRLFKTTKDFLRTFGMSTLDELPELGDGGHVEPAAPLDEEGGQIAISLLPDKGESA